jgi:hypothetical protein
MAEVGMNLILSPSILGFVIGTRAALGFGLGLLLADRIPEPRRRAIGLTLVAMGAASTIPTAISLFGHRAPSDANAEHVSTADV